MITYNHANFIREAIESVLAQETTFPIELVIGEDCSTDSTRSIVVDYAKRYATVVRALLPENNRGVTANGVATLKACRGEYVALLEGDDYWTDPRQLQVQLDFLDSHPAFALCHHDAEVIDSTGEVIHASVLKRSQKRDYRPAEVVRKPHFVTPTVCMRNIVDDLPTEFFEAFNGDTFLFSLLGLRGGAKYLGHRIRPSRYRRHSGGVWTRLGTTERFEKTADTMRLMAQYYGRLGRQGDARYYRASSYYKRSLACKSRGDVKGAGRWIRRALSARPWSPIIWRELVRHWSA